MILSSFEGRIGNNLFQLAACLSLAEFHKTEAWVANCGNLTYIKENFYLDDFKFVNIGDPNGFNFRRNLPIEIKTIFIEYGLNFNTHFFDTPDNTFIDGFFQSEKYFTHIIPKIRKNFKFKDHVIEKANKNINFNITEKSAFIHVRRGDYLQGNNQEAYPQPDRKKYYLKCIDENDIDLVYVFSDDIEWCKENYRGKKFIIIEETDPYVTLYMMSQIKTAIIANSTFSWWGAWLNVNEHKKVYYPLNWYGNMVCSQTGQNLQEYIKDLPCESWIGR